MTEFLTKEGQKYKDFALVNYLPIKEIQATLRELIHLPSGANVMHLENEDPENLFCLSFKTLPDNSNGVPHILEHTVLCGSRKYPVRDPFFAMSRRSLNTFMNALTGCDFTCYPAATQIEKDFYNLLEVYLDAVFHPKLNELSFLQEGHRLEFAEPDNPESPLEFKGIVYNEMKGAMSSVDSRVWHSLMEYLVPDLTYAHNSGGDPKEIPNLTYKELIAFHETYYHPSRCLFFFYGNFPLKKHLDFITEHALQGVPKLPPLDGIGHQTRFKKSVKKSFFYPIAEKDKLDEKHIHAFAWLTTPLLNLEEALALIVLDSVLMDTDASILRKALLDEKICIHVGSYLDIEMTEVPFAFIFRGCKENAEKVEKILFKNLEKISKEGIPYELVEAVLHQLEFSRTEIGGDHSPFGLTLFMRSALAKQHGCNPEHSLTLHSLFKEILDKAEDPFFFSPLIEKYMLHNPHFVRLSFAPDPKLTEKEGEEEKHRLKVIKENLTEKQIASILDATQKLATYQEEGEGQKLECLPRVTLSDVPEEARAFPLRTEQRRKMEVFHHDVFTNHILYSDLVFDLPNLNQQELSDLQLFITFWPGLGAGKRSYREQIETLHAHTGGIGAHVSLHIQASDPIHSKPSLQLHGKTLRRNSEIFFSLLQEIATVPRFDEKERIKELLLKLHASLQSRLSQNAMRYATQIALSPYSVANHINEVWYGISYYNYIHKLVQNFDQEFSLLLDRLEALKNKLLCNGSPHLVLCCDEDLFNELDKKDFYGLPNLLTKPFVRWKGEFDLQTVCNQARVIPSPIAFTTQGFKIVRFTHKDAPALQVSTALLDNKILHHRIREQGGAYGAGACYNPLWGNFYFYGYRDPHIAHTLHCFRDSVYEISDGNFEPRDLEEAKLGIVQHLDSPIAPGSRAISGYVWQRDGVTRQLRQNFRDRLLDLSPTDIQSALEKHLLGQINEGTIVTFAGKDLLDKELPLIEDKKLKILPIS